MQILVFVFRQYDFLENYTQNIRKVEKRMNVSYNIDNRVVVAQATDTLIRSLKRYLLF